MHRKLKKGTTIKSGRLQAKSQAKRRIFNIFYSPSVLNLNLWRITIVDKAVIYIHGKGGNAEEAIHYKPLFSNCDVIGLDYTAQFPWEAKEEFPLLFI